jgi:hypothetical protein
MTLGRLSQLVIVAVTSTGHAVASAIVMQVENAAWSPAGHPLHALSSQSSRFWTALPQATLPVSVS